MIFIDIQFSSAIVDLKRYYNYILFKIYFSQRYIYEFFNAFKVKSIIQK